MRDLSRPVLCAGEEANRLASDGCRRRSSCRSILPLIVVPLQPSPGTLQQSSCRIGCCLSPPSGYRPPDSTTRGNGLLKTLLDATQIHEAVTRLGQQIADDYRGRPLTVLGVLTGSIVVLTDLIRRIDIPLRVGLIQASSYRGHATSPGELSINDALLPDIRQRDVILVDDIFDTGHTMTALLDRIRIEQPASVRSAVLLWKQERTEVPLEPDYFCFRIPNEFVVGYGLDYNDEYRHLPYIAALEDDDLHGS